MKLSELISKYGDDKIEFQNLDNDAISLNYDHKKGTRITFGTDAPIDLNGTKKLGLVVWFDRESIKGIISEGK